MSKLVGVAVLLLAALPSAAVPITARFTGTGTGTLGGVSFIAAPFAIDASIDTDDVTGGYVQIPGGEIFLYAAPTDTASVAIGAFQATFAFPTLVFFNPATQTVGFRATLDLIANPALRSDFIGIHCGPACEGWSLDAPHDLVLDPLPSRRMEAVPTDLGSLSLGVIGAAGFRAIAVPEPSTAALVAGGLAALAHLRRRRA